MKNISFSQEPAAWVGVADAILILLVAFGIPITAEQKGAIDALLVAVSALIVRSQVTPTAKLPPPAPPA